MALGVRISGVDDSTYSQTGEAFSTIALPEMNTHTELSLQEDDTALVSFSELNTTFYHHSSHTHTHCAHLFVVQAYEFARKFPGYTADNLSEKGVCTPSC